jgi:hypothetical protein
VLYKWQPLHIWGRFSDCTDTHLIYYSDAGQESPLHVYISNDMFANNIDVGSWESAKNLFSTYTWHNYMKFTDSFSNNFIGIYIFQEDIFSSWTILRTIDFQNTSGWMFASYYEIKYRHVEARYLGKAAKILTGFCPRLVMGSFQPISQYICISKLGL